jgi:thioredoxin-related protein
LQKHIFVIIQAIMMYLRFALFCTLLLAGLAQTNAQTKSKSNTTPTQVQAESLDFVHWYEWNEGYEKAVKEGKIVLVDAYTDWCGWCKKMDRDTYTNKAVISKIESHFIPIKFNPEINGATYKVGDKTYSGAELYGLLCNGERTGFPTVYYIFPKKNGIFIDAGYKGPDAFLQVLDMAIAESKK